MITTNLLVKSTFIGMVLVCLAACAPKISEEVRNELEGMEISNARLTAPLKGRNIAAGYLDIKIEGEDDALVGASSPIAGHIELHTMQMDEGLMQMRRVEQIALPAGELVHLKPKGNHLMLFDVTISADQDDALLTLRFANGSELTIVADIMGSKTHKDGMAHTEK